tara:strand:- start:700 stop:1317 length:618 start_codon:yes stop_codon:yes gene_type:complete
MDYMADVKPLEDRGLADEQIASILSSFTKKDILLAEVENFLDFEGLAARNPVTGNWEGLLVSVIGGASQELSDGVSELFVHLNKPRSTSISTTQEEWATKCSLLLMGLVSSNVITSEQSNGFIDLGGGLLHGLLSAQDVDDSRQSYNNMREEEESRRQQEEAKLALTEEFFAAYNANVAPVLDQEVIEKAQLIQGLRDAANQLEV